jgi:hypothetical protein
MKVSELLEGMLVSPVGDNEIFVKIKSNRYKYPFITVRSKQYAGFNNYDSKEDYNFAMYIGRKKDLKITKEEHEWSDRFVVWGGEIAAVDPASWKRIHENR